MKTSKTKIDKKFVTALTKSNMYLSIFLAVFGLVMFVLSLLLIIFRNDWLMIVACVFGAIFFGFAIFVIIKLILMRNKSKDGQTSIEVEFLEDHFDVIAYYKEKEVKKTTIKYSEILGYKIIRSYLLIYVDKKTVAPIDDSNDLKEIESLLISKGVAKSKR